MSLGSGIMKPSVVAGAYRGAMRRRRTHARRRGVGFARGLRATLTPFGPASFVTTAEKEFDSPEFLQETTEVLTVKLRAKATDLPAQKDELVLLVKALRKTLKARPPARLSRHAAHRDRQGLTCAPLPHRRRRV